MKYSIFRYAIVIAYCVAFLWPVISFSHPHQVTWKGTYYHAIPNKTGVTPQYCSAHTLGTFLHTIEDARARRSIVTDRHIRLENAHFYMEKVHGVYLIHGDAWAIGKANRLPWKDHIYYYASKLTEAGITRGVWSTDRCKGLYIGKAVSIRRYS